MAAINVEFKTAFDPRFSVLGKHLCTNRFDALGRMVLVWIHCYEAQSHVVAAEELDALIEHEGFAEKIVKSKLAEVGEGGTVRVKGLEGRIEWLGKKREASKRGGEANKKRLEACREPNASQTLADGLAIREPNASHMGGRLESPSSTTTSSTTTNKKEELKALAVASAAERSIVDVEAGKATKSLVKPKTPPTGVGTFVASYVKAFQRRYGDKTRPDLGGKAQGQIKRFVEGTPLERAVNLIEVYLQMDDPWFKTKCHDFTTFLENQNKIGLALDTGQADPNGAGDIDISKIREAHANERR